MIKMVLTAYCTTPVVLGTELFTSKVSTILAIFGSISDVQCTSMNFCT